jgi:glycosyltransferase involved in cell wall biosynthesis
MTPRVSILIPCYNASATVVRAVESALAQTFRDIEVIVADDGSTDASLAVLERYRGDARVSIHAEPHRGGNGTRNRLLELARGEFVQFLDADDELDPEKIEACLAAYGEDVDVVFTDREFQGGDAGQVGRYPEPDGDVVEYFIRNSVVTMLPVSRLADVRAVGGFDPSLPCCQEYELHLRLALRRWRKVRHLPIALCTYYVTPGSISSNQGRLFATRAGVLRRFAEQELNAESLTTGRRDAIATEMMVCARILLRCGQDDDAVAAYAFARRLSPATKFPAKWPMRVAERIFGPVRAERARCWLTRRLRSG